MAEHQGAAEIKLRKRAMFVASNALVMGWIDDFGVRRGMTMTDWDTFSDVISCDESDAQIGKVVRHALLASRVGVPGEWADAQLAAADYDLRLASAFGLKNASKLYPGMKDVGARWALGDIIFAPSRHRRGSAFGGFPLGQKHGHEDVVVPFASSDAELGAAVRECFARCL